MLDIRDMWPINLIQKRRRWNKLDKLEKEGAPMRKIWEELGYKIEIGSTVIFEGDVDDYKGKILSFNDKENTANVSCITYSSGLSLFYMDGISAEDENNEWFTEVKTISQDSIIKGNN